MQNHFLSKNKTNGAKQKMYSSLTFSYPSLFNLSPQTCSGLKWNKKYQTKKKEGEARLGFGGLQGVKFKFVISHVQVSIKMLQLVQLSCQQDRFRGSQVPFSLLNKKGLGNWQDSLLDQWRNAVSTPCIFFFPNSSPLCVHQFMWRKSICGSLHHCIKSQKRAPSFVSSLVAEESSLLNSEMPFLTLFVPLTLAWVGHPIRFFFPVSKCVFHSLSVSRSESDHCTGLSFPLRWAYSMTAV